MPTSIFSQGYKKKPTIEPAGSPRSTPLEPGVYLPPEEDLPDYSPSEATPSSSVAAGVAPLSHAALHEAAVKRVEEKEQTHKRAGIISSLIGGFNGGKSLSPIKLPFEDEGPSLYKAAFQHNDWNAKPGPYNTELDPTEEAQFRQWVKSNRVPFDPNAKTSDYDMRGYWKQTGGKNWKEGDHFPDTYKTPYDTSFSNESKYSTADNPDEWQGEDLINKDTHQVDFAEGGLPAANIGASSQYATPREEGKLEVKPLSSFAAQPTSKPESPKPEKAGPLSAEEAVAAFEEQGTPPNMAAKLAQNPAVVQQLEESLAIGYGNTPHQTEGAPEPGNPQAASSAIISSNPKGKQHQDLLAAAHNKPQHVAHANHEVAQQLGHLGLDPQKVGALVKAAKKYGVAPELIASIGNFESTNGTSTLPGVSSGQNSAGAAGPFQIGNGTGESGDWWHEHMPSSANIYDYNTAAEGAAKYLSEAGATEDPETWYNAALSYNHADWYAEEVTNLAKEAASAPWSGASPASVTSTAAGPVAVPKGARQYFENEGAHLRFVPTFAHHLEKLAKLSGEPVAVNEGFRSEEEQAHLYELYENGEGNLAAPPGGSEHEKGLAADAQLTSHQRELLSAAGLDLPVPGEDWHLQLSEPEAIEQADQESATPVPGVASPLTTFTSAPSGESTVPLPVTETSTSTGAELLDQHEQKAAPEEDKPSLAMQLLFGGGESENPVNALLNSPLPSFGSPGISGDLSNEDLLKLLLERA